LYFKWQGADDDEFTYGESIYDAISETLNYTQVVWNQGVDFDNVIDIQSVVNDASGADVIILCVGEAPEAEYDGDINDLTLSAPQLQLYVALAELDIPIVLVLVEARPRVLDVASQADAIFMCYLPGPMGGQALAELLFGKTSP
jgi:beta-glucosidase